MGGFRRKRSTHDMGGLRAKFNGPLWERSCCSLLHDTSLNGDADKTWLSPSFFKIPHNIPAALPANITTPLSHVLPPGLMTIRPDIIIGRTA
jgi:hypothetical protein